MLGGKRLNRDQVEWRIFFLPLGQDLMVGFESSEEPGALKIHLHFMGMNSLQCYIQNYFLIWKKKKRNCRDLCVDSIFKSLVAGIIKVPIRLYWSLTFKDTPNKKRLLYSLLCRYLWCLYQKMSFQCKKKEQWLFLPPVWECTGIFYCWVGTEVCCEMIFMNAISWEAHRTENCMSWGRDLREQKSNK